jgi:hypothetical protein
VISVETILVALLGGSLGGVFAAWLQTRHESRQAFRERMITAADDLSTALLQASLSVDEARQICLSRGFRNAQNRLTIRDETGKVPDEIRDALKRADALIAEAQTRIGRVSLFFGTLSLAPHCATMAITELKLALDGLRLLPASEMAEVSEGRTQATKQIRAFNDQALQAIRGRPWWSRLRFWARRRWPMRRRTSGDERDAKAAP